MIALNGARSKMAAGRPGIALVLAFGLAVGLFAAPSRALAQGCFGVDSTTGGCQCGGGSLGSGYDRPDPDPPGQSSLPPVDLYGVRQCPGWGSWSLLVTVTWCGNRPRGCDVSNPWSCSQAANQVAEGVYYSEFGLWYPATSISSCLPNEPVGEFQVTLPATAEAYWVHTIAATNISVEHQ